ncbi:MAG: hypothetical protein M3O82_03300 [Verrucomicrobiota bacterium]|nr:hypothetical protein [Verrucomicrobiota bacterium]
MKISLRRSGGVTGISKTFDLDTSNLASAKTRQLHDLIAASGFFKLPAVATSPSHPDAFQYDLVIDTGAETHRVSFHENAAAPALQKLATAIEALA